MTQLLILSITQKFPSLLAEHHEHQRQVFIGVAKELARALGLQLVVPLEFVAEAGAKREIALAFQLHEDRRGDAGGQVVPV